MSSFGCWLVAGASFAFVACGSRGTADADVSAVGVEATDSGAAPNPVVGQAPDGVGNGSPMPASPEGGMPVEVLWQQGCTSDLHQREREALVIRDADALRDAYDASVGLDPENREEQGEFATVDFDSKVVIAAFFGSGGCGLEATFVADELDDVVDVRFVVVTRAQGCIGPDSRAYPYGFAALPLVDKPYEVSFETQRSQDACE